MNGSSPVRSLVFFFSVSFAVVFPMDRTVRGAEYGRLLDAVRLEANSVIAAGDLTGVSVLMVDDQRVVLSEGFGFADKGRRIVSGPDTVYRCGSISKLFTATAAMQLAEEGRLDIDEPVETYLPSFRIIDPFPEKQPITLRQLMCHRSGLVREAPVGGYLDPDEPSADRTVSSLSECVRVHPPGKVTKYSNSGVTVAGQVVAAVAGTSFPEYQRTRVLDRLGMKQSAWALEAQLKEKFAVGYLPVADGRGGFREIASPHFELGTIPAGNLYTTSEDLARFVRCLLAGGVIDGVRVLETETIERMTTPQLTTNRFGFGLGFSVGEYRDHRSISHSGAVYGFSSSLVVLPDLKVGAVVLANDDVAMGPVRRLSHLALDVLIAVKTGKPRPAPPTTVTPAPGLLAACIGNYESESYWAEIDEDRVPGQLRIRMSGQQLVMRPVGDRRFEANGRVAHRASVEFDLNEAGAAVGFHFFGQHFVRSTEPVNAAIPEAWNRFLGSYGPDFIPLIITARHGHLYAMTENLFDYRLTPLNGTVFRMPPGMYVDEELVFHLDRRGRVHRAVLANMPLPRRAAGSGRPDR